MRAITAFRNNALFQAALVFLVCFALHANILANGFVMDDYPQVLENSWIRNARYLPEIFSSNFAIGEKSSFYRPLVHVFYMIGYHLFGLRPWGFHLMSIVFHAGVSVLVFLTISRLLRQRRTPDLSSAVEGEGPQWIPLAAALLFATHPIHTEAVAWISVTDIYMTFFYLLSFYLYVRSSEGKGAWGAAYTLSVVSFFLATLCKEPALTLPAMLIAYDYVFRKEGEGISYYAKRYVPFFAAAGVYFGLRLHALGGMVTFKTPLKLTPYEYLVAVLALFRSYVEKLLLPVNLNVWHVFRPPTSLLSLPGAVSLLVAAVFFIAAVVSIRKNRVALLGFMLILLPLLPALYLPALTQGLENAFTERYLYLPSVGFILLAALLIDGMIHRKPERKKMIVVLLSLIVVAYAMGTAIRNTAWRDSYTLWTDVSKKSPESGEPYNALGDYYREKGMLDEAIEKYRRGIAINPGAAHIHVSLGISYAQKGLTDQALKEFRTALMLRPVLPDAHDSLGVIYAQAGNYDEAIREFRLAVKLNPFFKDAYRHLGLAYSDRGQTDEAVSYLEKALSLDPDSAEAHNSLGIVYGKSGALQAAIEHFEEAVRLKPEDPDFRRNLATAYKLAGSHENK